MLPPGSRATAAIPVYVGNNLGMAIGTSLAGLIASFSFAFTFLLNSASTFVFALFFFLFMRRISHEELAGGDDAGKRSSRPTLSGPRFVSSGKADSGRSAGPLLLTERAHKRAASGCLTRQQKQFGPTVPSR